MEKNEYTLEKLKISDRLEALEKSWDKYTSINEIKMKQNEDMIIKLNHIIIGNGKPGVDEKVRILEELEKTRKTHVKVFYTAIIAGFAEWLWRTVGHIIK